jgi:hypothetical protein
MACNAGVVCDLPLHNLEVDLFHVDFFAELGRKLGRSEQLLVDGRGHDAGVCGVVGASQIAIEKNVVGEGGEQHLSSAGKLTSELASWACCGVQLGNFSSGATARNALWSR